MGLKDKIIQVSLKGNSRKIRIETVFFVHSALLEYDFER